MYLLIIGPDLVAGKLWLLWLIIKVAKEEHLFYEYLQITGNVGPFYHFLPISIFMTVVMINNK